MTIIILKYTIKPLEKKANNPFCVLCKQKTHYIRNCPEFLKLSVHDRISQTKMLKLCTNCLRQGHSNSVCRLGNCRKCNNRHNTLLHITRSPETPVDENSENSITTLSACETNSNVVLLSTALIQVFDSCNEAHVVRAFLDSASQSSFITSNLCDKLKLKTENVSMAVTGINNVSSPIKLRCMVEIHSQFL